MKTTVRKVIDNQFVDVEVDVIFSGSGKVNGYGSERYKWVSGLTKEEQAAVKAGNVVIVEGSRPSGGGNGTGTYYREVTYAQGYGYGHRVPKLTDEQIEEVRYAE